MTLRRHFIDHCVKTDRLFVRRCVLFGFLFPIRQFDMRCFFSFCIAAFLASAGSVAAQDHRWQAHTSFREVTDVASHGDAVWAATTGGVFRYEIGSGAFSTYSPSEGLHGVAVRAITVDPLTNVIWIGYRDGVLDRLDPATGVVKSYFDIARAEQFSSQQINKIVVRGDSVFAATSFGVVVFDPVRNEVRDTYSKLGSLAAGTEVFDLTFAPGQDGDPAIWLATNAGVAYASMQSINLSDPAEWTVEAAGLPVRELRAIAWFEGAIYAGTTQDLVRRSDNGVYIPLGVTTHGIRDLEVFSDRMVGVERFTPFVVSGETVSRISMETYQDPVALIAGPDGNVWIGDTQGGLIAMTSPEISDRSADILLTEVYPDGPRDNLFSGLHADVNGNLWAIGFRDDESGFYRFDADGNWTNYVRRVFPELFTTYDRLHVDARGHAWIGSSGNALGEVSVAGAVRTWDAGNSSLLPAAGTNNYIIVGGIADDMDGRIWVTNPSSLAPIHVYEPEGEVWTAIPGVQCGDFSTVSATFDRIYIDAFDQQWIIVIDLANLRRVLGLLVLDVNETPALINDDACRFFDEEGAAGQGLPGTTVTSVVEDRDGIVWIGTDKGLAFVINNGIVAEDANAIPIWPQFADRTEGTYLLNGIFVNDLAVDPAGRLWVATNEGVTVIRQAEGGYEVVERFSAGNSPLFSDTVVAIAIDPISGRVYLATDQGLMSYEGGAIAPVEQVGEIKVYPNPVYMESDAAVSVFMEGLVEATALRIVTLTGEVVARLQTRGGRARWDGLDMQGRMVPSGMYLVIAVGEGGEGTAYGKVAVIR